MQFLDFLNTNFWIAFGSIATFLMAIATFLTLRQYQKEKIEREKREIYEKIIQPLLKGSDNTGGGLERIIRDIIWNESDHIGLGWEAIKYKNFY